MASKIYRGFLFSRLELAVLLLSAGRKKIVGPRLPHKEEVSDISMLQAVFKLTKRGLLDAGDTDKDSVTPSEEAFEFLKPMLEATRVIELTPYDDEWKQKFLYVTSDTVAIMELSQNVKEDQLAISSIPREDLDEYLRIGFDLEDVLPSKYEKSEEYIKEIDPEQIQLQYLKALKVPGPCTMKEWMDEVNKVAGVEAVFALRFFRSSDGELTRLGMMCRGKYMNYRIECSASNILDDEKNSMQVFIDSEELWSDL